MVSYYWCMVASRIREQIRDLTWRAMVFYGTFFIIGFGGMWVLWVMVENLRL